MDTVQGMQKIKELIERFSSNPNLGALFNDIRERGPLKKSAAGASLPVSRPTRYALMQELIDSGVVDEKPLSQGEEQTRRSSIIDVVGDRYFSLGLDIHMEGIDLVLVDLNGSIASRLNIPNSIDHEKNMCRDTKNVIIERIRKGIEGIVGTSGVRASSIIAMGISDSGTIDNAEGISVYNLFIPEWTDVPIRSILNRVIQVPTYLMHDANLMTLAEIRELNLRNSGDLMCITLRRGIGLGIYIDHQIYSGQSGNAGELSQTHVFAFNKDGIQSQKLDIDSLLGYQSMIGLRSRLPNSHVPGSPEESPLRPVFQAYEAGNGRIVDDLDRYIDLLGNRIANLVLILDTGNLVLAGRFVDCGDRFVHNLSEAIKKYLPYYRHKLVRITRGKLGVRAASLGAAQMAQDMLFNSHQKALS